MASLTDFVDFSAPSLAGMLTFLNLVGSAH